MSSPRLYDLALGILGSCSGPILDLGCGRGDFLAGLRDRGVADLTGCDGYDHAEGGPARGFQFVKTDLNGPLPFQSESFAIVTALEVIEHLENPRLFVREIHRVLKPGGRAVVSTPNNESLTSLLSLTMRGHFSAFADACYPAHISPLLRVDLMRIFREAGFQDARWAWTDRGRIPGSDRAWQSISKRLFRGRLYSDNMMLYSEKGGSSNGA